MDMLTFSYGLTSGMFLVFMGFAFVAARAFFMLVNQSRKRLSFIMDKGFGKDYMDYCDSKVIESYNSQTDIHTITKKLRRQRGWDEE